MYRKCPQTLDKPILICGLDVEELALLALIEGIGSILIGLIVPSIICLFGWFILIQSKKNKPLGYLLHLLYTKGFEVPGLIPPIKKVSQYSAYGKSNYIKEFSLY